MIRVRAGYDNIADLASALRTNDCSPALHPCWQEPRLCLKQKPRATVETQSKLPLVGRRWRRGCFFPLSSPPPEPQPIPLLTLWPSLLPHKWFVLLGSSHAEARVNSCVTSFTFAPLGSNPVSCCQPDLVELWVGDKS